WSRRAPLQLVTLPAELGRVEYLLDPTQHGVEALKLVGVLGRCHAATVSPGPGHPPLRTTRRGGRAVVRLLGRDVLQPGERGPVVAHGELQRGRAELVALLAGLPRLVAAARQLLGVVVDRGVPELAQLRRGLLIPERDPQGHRVAQRVPPRLVGEPAQERPPPGRRDRIRLAGAGTRLAELDVA